MQVTILGCGTSIGVPVIGCDCPVCRANRPRNRRTRTSALIELDGGEKIIIDTSPDFRAQALRHNLRRLDALFYTHMHADHTHGIDEVRCINYIMQKPLDVYAVPAHIRHIKNQFSYIFQEGGQEGGGRPRLTMHAVKTGRAFELFGQKILPLRLLHGRLLCVGWRIGAFAYLTDVSRIPAETYPLLAGVKVLVIDALRFKPHETHFCLDEALAEIKRIAPQRAVITHISHDIDYYRDSQLLPEGVEFAYDGLEMEITSVGYTVPDLPDYK